MRAVPVKARYAARSRANATTAPRSDAENAISAQDHEYRARRVLTIDKARSMLTIDRARNDSCRGSASISSGGPSDYETYLQDRRFLSGSH